MVNIYTQDVEQYKDYVKTYIEAFHTAIDRLINKGVVDPTMYMNWDQFKKEFYLRLKEDWIQRKIPLSTKGINIEDVNYFLADMEPWMEEMFRKSIYQKVVPEAEEIVTPTTTLGHYRQYLWNKEYDKAREEFSKMSPEEQEEAYEIAKRIFAASLYGLHNTLTRQSFISEAKLVANLLNKIDQQIKSELKKEG